MAQSPVSIGDYIGLFFFLLSTAGIVYLIYTMPATVDSSLQQAKKGLESDTLSYSDGRLAVRTQKRYGVEDATYAMAKGGREMASKVKATGAVTFKKGDVATPATPLSAAKSPKTPDKRPQ